MSKKTEAVDLIKAICSDDSHGYDQINRWGQDYDCSSLIIHVWESVGVKVKSAGATYTENMRPAFLRCGFEDVTSRINLATGSGLESGDVLLNIYKHTAMYIGGGMIAHASINELGTVTGGRPGDQTGKEICTRSYFNYPWDCVLRYKEVVSDSSDQSASSQPELEDGVYTVRQGDTLWGIASMFLGNGSRYKEIQTANGLTSAIIKVGQRLKIPGADESADAGGATTHTVKSGDTLWGLAQRYLGSGARYKEIMALNGLSSETIRPGQTLSIPQK